MRLAGESVPLARVEEDFVVAILDLAGRHQQPLERSLSAGDTAGGPSSSPWWICSGGSLSMSPPMPPNGAMLIGAKNDTAALTALPSAASRREG